MTWRVLPAAALAGDGTVLAVGADDRLERLPVEMLRRQGDAVIVRAGALAGRDVVAELTPLLGAGIKVAAGAAGGRCRARRPGPVAEATPEMVELTDERRARLVAFVEGNTRMPDEAQQRVLAQLAGAEGAGRRWSRGSNPGWAARPWPSAQPGPRVAGPAVVLHPAPHRGEPGAGADARRRHRRAAADAGAVLSRRGHRHEVDVSVALARAPAPRMWMPPSSQVLEPALTGGRGRRLGIGAVARGRGAASTLEFEPGWDMGRAAEDVQSAVDARRRPARRRRGRRGAPRRLARPGDRRGASPARSMPRSWAGSPTNSSAGCSRRASPAPRSRASPRPRPWSRCRRCR